ncbi:MAG TPA: hypothetical protein VF277_02220 [Steroidobacteraceae bacterium]
MSDTHEHFRGAVRVLIGAGAVKQRLIAAYLEHLRDVPDDDLPDAVCLDFAELRSALSCAKPAGGLTAAEVAVRKMSEQDAAAHAERILAMYLMLSGVEGTAAVATPPRLRVVGDDDDLPAFLSRA